MAFGYYSAISINAAQVPSTQTDFPVLVNVTDARFKTVGNSGHVQNSSGFDIRPYTDSTLSTAITGYELEFYDGTNGILVMWVKVASLSSSTTPFVIAYGDSGITTDGSSTTTWSNSFLTVCHLKDGTTLDVTSSTGSNNGTNHGATATAGKIDGAGSFVSVSSQYVDFGSGMNPIAITMSAWAKGTTFPNAYNNVISKNATGNVGACLLLVKSTGKLACAVNTNTTTLSYDGTGSNTLSAGTFYYLTFVYDSSSGLIGYVNASVDGTVAANADINNTGASIVSDIGQDPINAGRFWNGLIDEARYSSVVRSPNWITTEYNNQSAPGTFETLGTEVSNSPMMGIYTI